jgi:hypothetical protein
LCAPFVSVTPQPLPVNGAALTGTLINQNYQIYYFDADDNNSFVGGVLGCFVVPFFQLAYSLADAVP